MRKSSIFWGIVVILAGVLLLLNTFGLLSLSVWKIFWPAFLVILGIWFILGPRLHKGNELTQEHLAVPIEAITEAEVIFKHGAGHLRVDSDSESSFLLEGDFGGGVEQKTLVNGSQAKVQLSAVAENFIPFGNSEGLSWLVKLNRAVKYRLTFKTGASESTINLGDLLVQEVSLETGASKSDIILPAHAGMTRVEVKAGAAEVNIHVPEGVAGHIRVESGLAGISVAANRFPASGGIYETPGYATAENKVEIYISTGLGAVNIK